MSRLTKRVGCGESVTINDGDICEAFIKTGKCKTGLATHSDGEYGYQRHCNDECELGMMIDRLAAYEDIGGSDEIVKVVRCGECIHRNDAEECPLLYYNRDMLDEHTTDDDNYCSYGEREDKPT